MKHRIAAILVLGTGAAVGCNTTPEDSYEPQDTHQYEIVEADQQVSLYVTGMT